MSEQVIKAALLGLGTVGNGVYKVLKNQRAEMQEKLGKPVEISKILVRNLEQNYRQQRQKKPFLTLMKNYLTNQYQATVYIMMKMVMAPNQLTHRTIKILLPD